MERESLRDLRINGVGSAAGGSYRNVKIDGVCKVGENLKAESCDVNGVVRMAGDVDIGLLECNGKLTIGGSVQSIKTRVDGIVNVKGSYQGEQLMLKGIFNVDGDCSLERFEGEGAFEISGLLNMDSIAFKLHGRCQAKEIGGSSIRIRKGLKSNWNKLWQWLFPKFSPELHATVIEGDVVELEHTTAAIVRGGSIRIGPGCSIGKVEYREELLVHPSARIGKEEKQGA